MLKLCIDSGGTKIAYSLFEEDKIIDQDKIYFNGNLVNNFSQTKKKFFEIVKKYASKKTKVLIGGAGVITAGSKIDEIKKDILMMENVVNCEIIADVFLSALANLKNENGLMLVAGTGSAMVYKNDDDFKIIGGYGYILGDTASGFDFGSRLLKEYLSLKELDVVNDFTFEIESYFKTNNERAIIKFLMNSPQKEVSSLSKVFMDKDFCNYITLEFLLDVKKYIFKIMSYTNSKKIVLDGSIVNSIEVRKFFTKYDYVSFANEELTNAILYYTFKEEEC